MNTSQVSAALNEAAAQTGISRAELAAALMTFLNDLQRSARFPWSVLLSLLTGYISKAIARDDA